MPEESREKTATAEQAGVAETVARAADDGPDEDKFPEALRLQDDPPAAVRAHDDGDDERKPAGELRLADEPSGIRADPDPDEEEEKQGTLRDSD